MIGPLVFVVGLVAISGVSCTAEYNEAAYLERVQDWTNSLSFTMVGLRVDDYYNSVFSKYEVVKKVSEVERSLLRWVLEIEKTTPPPGLEDIHQQIESLTASVIEYATNLREVLSKNSAPHIYVTPFKRPQSFKPYPVEVENIFGDRDRLLERIKEFQTVIAAQLEMR